jgi:hypothetical protein
MDGSHAKVNPSLVATRHCLSQDHTAVHDKLIITSMHMTSWQGVTCDASVIIATDRLCNVLKAVQGIKLLKQHSASFIGETKHTKRGEN